MEPPLWSLDKFFASVILGLGIGRLVASFIRLNLYRTPIITGALAVTVAGILATVLLDHAHPKPYMDEIFHVPQV